MADKDATPNSFSLESGSEAIVEAAKTPTVDQPGMLNRTDPNVSVPTVAQATLSATEINEDAKMYSNAVEPSISESSSIQISPQTVVGVSEDEHQSVEDDPTVSLVCPRDEKVFSSIAGVDNGTSDQPSHRQPLCMCMCCCFTMKYDIFEDEQPIPFYTHYTRKIRNSTIPVSSMYFGVIYKDSCPMSRFSPVLQIIMGIVGVILIFVRLITISIRRFAWNMKEPPKLIHIALMFMLMVLLKIEMVYFHIPTPVFENPKDPAFCEKTFYDYVYYMNIAALVIGILASLVHIPQKPRIATQTLPQ
ncbi:hypothetical protein HNY73_002843 [Argiope bruennichi]|uniref:Uncharacterized protein n=1 Tax=Argiope bruennichi TaxID=94029 RepID=A0A8T0FV14_ARGBR|nr:hypothetical protein HNY73_002843 [Argiope bruennichi]